MMVEMSDDIGELLSALFKLEALQLRLGITAAEAMPTFGGGANQPIGALNNAMPSGCGAGYRSETDRRSRIRLSMPAACEFFGRRHSGCGPRCSGGGARHRIGRAGYHPAAMFRSCAGRRFRCPALERAAVVLRKRRPLIARIGVGMAWESVQRELTPLKG